MSSRNTIDLRGRRPAPRARPAASPPKFAREKPSVLRARRRRTRLFTVAAIVFLVALIVFQLSYVSYLPRYMVHKFAIEGTRTLSPDMVGQFITAYLHPSERTFFSPHNIFSFNKDALASSIVASFPRIKSVEVSRDSLLASAILVTVHEREEFALWCPTAGSPMEQCYGMDDTGFIFAHTKPSARDTTSTLKYIFTGGTATSTTPLGASFAPGHFPGILAFFDGLQRVQLNPIAASVDDNGTDFTVTVAEGFGIKASFGQDARTLANNLQIILHSEEIQGREADIAYVDLRFGDKAYYKLRGEE